MKKHYYQKIALNCRCLTVIIFAGKIAHARLFFEYRYLFSAEPFSFSEFFTVITGRKLISFPELS